MHKIDLTMDRITKVEGSASLHLTAENGKVTDVKFAIEEYKRFFTNALQGKPLSAAASHLSRICGTCSSAHIMCSIEACENALGLIPSDQTKMLRVLATHGNIIRDHALHLYLFCLPDIYNVDAFLDLDENVPEQHQLLHDGFDIKSAGNYLATLVAGRSVHATYPVIGGFLHFPDPAGVEEAIEKLKMIRPAVIRLIQIFKNAPYHFDPIRSSSEPSDNQSNSGEPASGSARALSSDKTQTSNGVNQTYFMALVPENNFGYLHGKIVTSRGETYESKDFRAHLEHTVIPYSQASGYKYQGEGYMVGALARLNLAKDKLHPETKKTASEALKLFPSTDIFLNNLAQAIEILHSVDESIELLEKNEFKPEPIVKAEPKEAVGVAVVEAPRGTLYHKISVGADGIIKEGEVIVPTGQNQINIERDIGKLVEDLLAKPAYADGSSEAKEKIALEIEKLIRAYDPCMSCASHFLKVEWTSKTAA